MTRTDSQVTASPPMKSAVMAGSILASGITAQTLLRG